MPPSPASSDNRSSDLVLNPSTGKPEQKVMEQSPSPFDHVHTGVRRVQKLSLSYQDAPLVRSCVLTYFENHPELHGGLVNAKRSEALRELSANLQCPIQYIRRWILEAGYSLPKHYITDGSQYKYIYEHLDDLINQYRDNQLSLQGYHLDIFFYLSGMTSQVNPDSMHSIQKRTKQLGLTVRQPSDKRDYNIPVENTSAEDNKMAE
jgi:hypothetical protein